MTELMGPKMPFQNRLPRRVNWWSSQATSGKEGAGNSGKQQNNDQVGGAKRDHAIPSSAISSSQKP